MRVTALCITLAALAACERVDRRQPPPPPPQASQDVDTVAPAQPQVSPNAGSRATKVGTVVGLLTPESVLDDVWPLNELDYYGVGVVGGTNEAAKVVVPPEDRSGEFGPSLYGRWLQEVLYDRVVKGEHAPQLS